MMGPTQNNRIPHIRTPKSRNRTPKAKQLPVSRGAKGSVGQRLHTEQIRIVPAAELVTAAVVTTIQDVADDHTSRSRGVITSSPYKNVDTQQATPVTSGTFQTTDIARWPKQGQVSVSVICPSPLSRNSKRLSRSWYSNSSWPGLCNQEDT